MKGSPKQQKVKDPFHKGKLKGNVNDVPPCYPPNNSRPKPGTKGRAGKK